MPTNERWSLAGAVVLLLAVWAITPPGAFTIDEFLYHRMAATMASEGRLSIVQMWLDGVPATNMGYAFPIAGGRAMPQYPSGYAVLAAPFYAVGGVKGLMLLNTLAALLCLWSTFRIARRLGADDDAATLAVWLLVAGSYITTYTASIWPHALATAIATASLHAALAGVDDGHARRLLLAGLFVGLGCSVRIDVIVLAPSIFLWLRVSGVPDSRPRLARFLAGLAIGLALTAALNYAKFQSWNAFSYRNDDPQNDPRQFATLAVVLAVVLMIAMSVDLHRLVARVQRASGVRTLVGALVLLAVALVASPRLRILCGGYYTFLIDQQAFAFADSVSGVVRNKLGFLVFYGTTRKAILQSMPYAVLLAWPAWHIVRGRAHRDVLLLALAALAYLTLYALNQIDAGLSFNQRFLLPLLPIIAVLSANEIQSLRVRAGRATRLEVYAAITGATLFSLALIGVGDGTLQAFVTELYLPLACAGVVGILAWSSSARASPRVARAALVGVMATVGVSTTASAYDLVRTTSLRGQSRAEAHRLSAMVEPGALVFTRRVTFWGGRATTDVSVARPTALSTRELDAIVTPFFSAGRAVYVHGAPTASDSLLARYPRVPMPGSQSLQSGPLYRVSAPDASHAR